jgi:O-acetyl-ADP-ribose deacetylase (regulator of RNase III)
LVWAAEFTDTERVEVRCCVSVYSPTSVSRRVAREKTLLGQSWNFVAGNRTAGMDFTVVQGDIARQSADVLVNAAGTSLRMGSGVAGALRRGAGQEINKEATSKGPVELGEVAVTDAYDLDAEWVIHAAAMPHYDDGNATAASIADATQNSLREADALGAESLVIPALGTGIAGFELAEGARIICECIHEYDPESLVDVGCIAYSDEDFGTMQAVAERVRAGE